MIARLNGSILDKQPPQLLIDVNGVGYDVLAPVTTFYVLPNIGEKTILHTHLSVSENSHQLFGFASIQDRELFRMLIKVNGVGPKLAIGIMSMEACDFAHCIKSENLAALVKLPGVGKKTAERLLVDMRDKIEKWASAALPEQAQDATPLPLLDRVQTPNSMMDDAQSALVSLGYKPVEASKAISTAFNDSIESSEALIRAALKGMI